MVGNVAVAASQEMDYSLKERDGHPFLKGLGVTVLYSIVYALTFLFFIQYPLAWTLLEYSFLPVVLGVNIGWVALRMKRKQGTLDGLGRYAAGAATAVVLDLFLFITFVVLFFTT